MRHTAASWAAQEGLDLREIGKVLGHRDSKTTERYARLLPKNTRQFGERIDAHGDIFVTVDDEAASGEA